MGTETAMAWTYVAAICHGAFSLGLTGFVAARYLFARHRAPMLLIALGFALVTIYSVRSIAVWGNPMKPWFWVAIIGWIFSDFGLFLYLVMGPPAPRRHKEGA